MKRLRILLDESVPAGLVELLPDFDVSTVRKQWWNGLQNGVLLRAAVEAGFEVLITFDRSIPSQQNLQAIGIAVVTISGVHNNVVAVRPLIPQIVAALRAVKPGVVIRVMPAGRDSIFDAAVMIEVGF